jgi:hypothetical protein
MPDPATDNLPLPIEGAGSAKAWTSRIEDAKELRTWHRDQFFWTTNVERYVGKGKGDPLTPTGVTILPKDYAYTEQKKPLLFYQLPDVVLTAARPDVTPETAQLFQAVLNEMTGPNDLNALATVTEVLTDVLVASGIGIVKLGYESFIDPQQPTREVQVGEQPAVDPATGIPIADPTTGQPFMQPVMAAVPNIIRERYFLERVSPLDFLYDVSYRGSDWGKCPWMGWRFRMPAHLAAREYGVNEDDLHDRTTDTPTTEQSLAPDRSKQRFSGVEGTEIYYRAIDFDPEAGDPDLMRCLIFLDGIEKPVRHENSRTQQVEEGRVVAGLRRSPIYPLTLRYVPDMPIPPSDCAMSRVIVDELSKGRNQMLEQRDRNVPMRGISLDKVTPDSREKLVHGEWQEIIGFENVAAGDQVMFGIPLSAYPQENFNFNSIGERDLQECWALSGHNLGTSEQSSRTATELSLRQQGTETRMASEQARVELWWVSIVEGLASLVQQYSDLPQYAKVVGQDGAAKIMEWTKAEIAGEFAFAIRPDSAKRVDQAAERKFRLDAMNLMMNIPGINQQELIAWAAPALGLDPAKVFQPPQKVEEPPEPVSITYSLSSEDLNPILPTYANTVAILKSRGIDLAPAAPMAASPVGMSPASPPSPGGGPVRALAGAPPVSKHAADMTGRLDGAGSGTTSPA